MPRKITDIYPVVTVTPQDGGCCTDPDHAKLEAEGMVRAILGTLGRRAYTADVEIKTEARCEHCNATWTEASADYNGGCCGKDDANAPERLASLRRLAETVCGGDYVRLEDDRKPGRQSCDWPWALASAALKWLDAGRPDDGVAELVPLIARVDLSDWGTWWDDPGDYPSNAGSGPLPSTCALQAEPAELASDLSALLDDMGLLTAAKMAAA